jgi:hypothetical protein
VSGTHHDFRAPFALGLTRSGGPAQTRDLGLQLRQPLAQLRSTGFHVGDRQPRRDVLRAVPVECGSTSISAMRSTRAR